MKFSLAFLAIVAILVVSTEGGRNCQRQAKKAKKAGRTPPTCQGESKLFAPKQCADGACFCAKEKSGRSLYGDFKFPENEDYDCSSKSRLRFSLFVQVFSSCWDFAVYCSKCTNRTDDILNIL